METIAATLFFAAYALLSVIYQIESPLKKRLSRYDRLGLLPSWAFFAPMPGTFDYRLVFVDFIDSRACSSWNEVELYSSAKISRFLWNPDKHSQKCVSDHIQHLLIESAELVAEMENDRAVLISWSYIQLLKLTLQLPKIENATHRQFAIVKTQGFVAPRDVQILFISRRHALL